MHLLFELNALDVLHLMSQCITFSLQIGGVEGGAPGDVFLELEYYNIILS